jgi:hypothetical protein
LTPPEGAGSLPAAPYRHAGRTVMRLGLALGVAGCAARVESGPPIADPAVLASRAMARRGAEEPSLIRLQWRYGDRRGEIRGDGVARFNPPDSLRLDLFTSGDLAMAVAVAGGELRSQGDMEDVEVPPLQLVFAMAGLFRPGESGTPRAFEAGRDSVLVYGGADAWTRYYFLRGGRLRRVEDRRHGSTVRLVKIEWPTSGDWPTAAEYRNLRAPSRVRWSLERVTMADERFHSDIYELPARP